MIFFNKSLVVKIHLEITLILNSRMTIFFMSSGDVIMNSNFESKSEINKLLKIKCEYKLKKFLFHFIYEICVKVT